METIDKLERIKTDLKEYIDKSGTSGKVVIGISGGIDSAVVGKICCDVLGRVKVYMYYLPDNGSLDTDILRLQKFLKKTIHIKNIRGIRDSFDSVEWNHTAKINISPRIRMTILYAMANQHNALVMGTCNKSELMVGYATKFGDGACDYEVIGSLYKTEVYEVAELLGIPQKIIDKVPTAGLYEGQTDEGELGMSYEELDRHLKYIESLYPSDEKYPYLYNVLEMVMKSQHKRKMPPIAGMIS